MSKPLIIALIGAFAIIAIIVTVVLLAPNSKVEEMIAGQKPVEQKNLISDVAGLFGSLYGAKS
jgi:hypothetical protein